MRRSAYSFGRPDSNQTEQRSALLLEKPRGNHIIHPPRGEVPHVQLLFQGIGIAPL